MQLGNLEITSWNFTMFLKMLSFRKPAKESCSLESIPTQNFLTTQYQLEGSASSALLPLLSFQRKELIDASTLHMTTWLRFTLKLWSIAFGQSFS